MKSESGEYNAHIENRIENWLTRKYNSLIRKCYAGVSANNPQIFEHFLGRKLSEAGI